jgi:ATP-binding cassette subfamily F protein 3
MDMRQALTVALQEFAGAILLISHDRHLLANSVDDFYLVDQGQVSEFAGDLEDYRQFLLGKSMTQASDVKPKASEKKSKGAQTKSDQKAQRQIKTQVRSLESRLERLNEKLAQAEAKLADNALYEPDQADTLHDLIRSQQNLKEEITQAEEDWLDLSEQLDD